MWLCSFAFVLIISVYLVDGLLHNLLGFRWTEVDMPWQVSVQVHSWHYCVGSIIAPTWVLTSASCTSGKIAKSLTVRVGSTAHNRGGTIVKLTSIVQHNEFISSLHQYDFSLLQLAEPLTFSRRIQPIALPTDDDIFNDGQFCSVSGWGEPKFAKYYQMSRTATLIPIVNQQMCNEIYANIHDISENMMCAGTKKFGKLICRGDLGSPLVCANAKGTIKLTGMVSWAEGCIDAKYPGVYARVQAVRSWIMSIAFEL